MKKIYKFIPLIITIFIGAFLCFNPSKGSVLYMILNPDRFPHISTEVSLIVFSGYIILPTIFIITLGTIGVEKFKQGKKSLFIIWIILFLVWLFWILTLTRWNPIIDPLRTVL
jgi:cellulose synthase/poly-beta-1,6-N-acetylglucosamine synthase-like glycosyltransferase